MAKGPVGWNFKNPPVHMLCKAKRAKGQCGNYPLKGSDYCKFHGGRKAAEHRIRLDKIPVFYSRHLRGTLKQLLDECAQEDPAQQVQLYEELALTRRSVLDAVVLYEACIDNPDLKTETKELAGQCMRAALREVEHMVSACAKLEALKKDKISAHNLDYAASQLTRIAFEVFGEENPAKAEAFRARIQECLKVAREEGTRLTPDQDAMDMDDSVPGEPDNA